MCLQRYKGDCAGRNRVRFRVLIDLGGRNCASFRSRGDQEATEYLCAYKGTKCPRGTAIDTISVAHRCQVDFVHVAIGSHSIPLCVQRYIDDCAPIMAIHQRHKGLAVIQRDEVSMSLPLMRAGRVMLWRWQINSPQVGGHAAPHKIDFPNSDSTSSTAMIAVSLRSSRIGLTSTTSIDCTNLVSASISMSSWASR